MRFIEDFIQRVLALALTAIWFVIPLGVGWLHAPQQETLVEVDASRFVEREVVYVADVDTLLEEAAAAVQQGEDGDVEENDAPDIDETPTEETPGGLGGTGGSDRMERPEDNADTKELTPERVRTPDRTQSSLAGVERRRRPGHESGTAERGRTRPSGRRCAEPTPYIDKVSTTHWTVSRDMIEEYAADTEKLYALGWVRRYENDRGRRDGFEVRGIRCGTPLHQGGLKNRDIVHRVNGRKVNNVFQAWGAYRSARRTQMVDLEITRDGERMVLSYTVVD